MTIIPVHVAVFDTLADWEIGYATAHIRSDQWQREPGRYSVCAVGPAREPVTKMGGLRITPDIALGLYEPGVAASWFKLYADRDPAGFYELMSA